MSVAVSTGNVSSRMTRGYAICLVGVVLWSSAAVFIRYLTQTYQIPALVLAFWRDFLLATSLGIVFALFKPALLKVERRHLRFLLAYGLLLSLFNSLWTISVAINGAAVSTVLVYSSSAFTAVLGWRIFGERLNFLKITAVTLSLAGCIFVSGAYDPSTWRLNPVGVVTGLLSGLAFAAYSLLGKSAARRNINPWTTIFYTFAMAVPFLFSYNLLPWIFRGLNALPWPSQGWLPVGMASTEFFWLGSALAGWVVLFLLAIGPTLGGYGLYTVSLNYLPASVANLLATLEPVMTATLSFVLLSERFTTPQWIGSVLIIGGVIVLRLSETAGVAEQEDLTVLP